MVFKAILSIIIVSLIPLGIFAIFYYDEKSKSKKPTDSRKSQSLKDSEYAEDLYKKRGD